MFSLLYALNVALIIFSFIFLLRGIYKYFLDDGIPKILLLILFFLLAMIVSIKVIDFCNLADWDYKQFLDQGYTPESTLKWQAAATVLHALFYLYILRAAARIKKRIEYNEKTAEQKKWSGQ